jgi:hypothetical protein
VKLLTASGSEPDIDILRLDLVSLIFTYSLTTEERARRPKQSVHLQTVDGTFADRDSLFERVAGIHDSAWNTDSATV